MDGQNQVLLRALFLADDAPALPDSWRHAFIHEHLDSDSKMLLFRLNKPANRAVLRSAKAASISLQLDQQPTEETSRTLAVARDSLLTRGAHPSELALKQAGANPEALLLLPQALMGLHVQELSVDLLQHYEPALATPTLSALAAALPNLAALDVGQLSGDLPDPAHLPRLRRLRVKLPPAPAPASVSSVARYLPQLHKLTVGATTDLLHTDTARSIFTPGTHSTSLQDLGLGCIMDDQLWGLISQHCPHLHTLAVHSTDIRTQQPASVHWDKLTLLLGYNRSDRVLPPALSNLAAQLLLLPQSVKLAVAVLPPRRSALTSMHLQATVEGLPSAFLARVPQLVFFKLDMVLLPSTNDTAGQVQALTTSLTQLSQLRAEHCSLYLGKVRNDSAETVPTWQWSPELLQVLSAALPGLPHLNVHLVMPALGDSLVDSILQHAPQLKHVDVASGAEDDMLTQDHSHQPCAWESFTLCGDVRASTLLHLPRPVVPGRKYQLEVHGGAIRCDITVEQAAEAVQRLALRLSEDYQLTGRLQSAAITCPAGTAPEHQAQLLRVHLEVLSLLHVRAHADIHSVRLWRWNLTGEAIHQLQHLPAHISTSELTLPPGPWPDCPCDQLAAHIPQNYSIWSLVVPDNEDSKQQVKDIIMGLKQHWRGSDVMLDVTGVGLASPWLQAVHQYVVQLGAPVMLTPPFDP